VDSYVHADVTALCIQLRNPCSPSGSGRDCLVTVVLPSSARLVNPFIEITGLAELLSDCSALANMSVELQTPEVADRGRITYIRVFT
jgi:hypothetical protein